MKLPSTLDRINREAFRAIEIEDRLNQKINQNIVIGTGRSLVVTSSGGVEHTVVVNDAGDLGTELGGFPSGGGGQSLTAGAGIDITSEVVSVDIDGLTTDNLPDNLADYVMSYDASAGGLKKILLSNLPSATGATLAGLTDTAISGSPTGKFLKFDGADWVDTSVTVADISDLPTANVSAAGNWTFTGSLNLQGANIIDNGVPTTDDYGVLLRNGTDGSVYRTNPPNSSSGTVVLSKGSGTPYSWIGLDGTLDAATLDGYDSTEFFDLSTAGGSPWSGVLGPDHLGADANIAIGRRLEITSLGPATAAWVDPTDFSDVHIDLYSANVVAGSGTEAYNVRWGKLGQSSGIRARIGAYQSGSDDDQMGLRFYTHPSAVGTDPLVLAMQIGVNDLTINENLVVSGSNTVTLDNYAHPVGSQGVLYTDASGNLGAVGNTASVGQVLTYTGAAVPQWFDLPDDMDYDLTGTDWSGVLGPDHVGVYSSPQLGMVLQLSNLGPPTATWTVLDHNDISDFDSEVVSIIDAAGYLQNGDAADFATLDVTGAVTLDNFNHPTTSAGVLYTNASGQLGSVTDVPSTGQVLTFTGAAVPQWSDVPSSMDYDLTDASWSGVLAVDHLGSSATQTGRFLKLTSVGAAGTWSALDHGDISDFDAEVSSALSAQVHDASDITTGTLPLARGGTGVSSWTANRLVKTDGSGNLATSAAITTGQYVLWNGSEFVGGSGGTMDYDLTSASWSGEIGADHLGGGPSGAGQVLLTTGSGPWTADWTDDLTRTINPSVLYDGAQTSGTYTPLWTRQTHVINVGGNITVAPGTNVVSGGHHVLILHATGSNRTVTLSGVTQFGSNLSSPITVDANTTTALVVMKYPGPGGTGTEVFCGIAGEGM